MSAQEKVEIEQVPLKSDVDTTPMIDDVPGDNEVLKPIKKKTSCKWFFRKKNGEVTTNNGDIVAEENKTHCKWWTCRHKAVANNHNSDDDTEKQQMTVGVNMLDRDENDLNNHIVMDFSDVFAEPDSSHSWNWTWLSANRVYSFTSTTVYKILASLIAIPLAVIFGIIFGVLSVIGIYICTPLGRLLSVPCMAIAKAWNFTVRRLMDPVFASIGLMCPKAHHHSTINTSPTDLA
uniref:Caveolin n=1 Tax=Syphacia muris TaxID=451379 RepID=A0A158R5M5_9BILA